MHGSIHPTIKLSVTETTNGEAYTEIHRRAVPYMRGSLFKCSPWHEDGYSMFSSEVSDLLLEMRRDSYYVPFTMLTMDECGDPLRISHSGEDASGSKREQWSKARLHGSSERDIAQVTSITGRARKICFR